MLLCMIFTLLVGSPVVGSQRSPAPPVIDQALPPTLQRACKGAAPSSPATNPCINNHKLRAPSPITPTNPCINNHKLRAPSPITPTNPCINNHKLRAPSPITLTNPCISNDKLRAPSPITPATAQHARKHAASPSPLSSPTLTASSTAHHRMGAWAWAWSVWSCCTWCVQCCTFASLLPYHSFLSWSWRAGPAFLAAASATSAAAAAAAPAACIEPHRMHPVCALPALLPSHLFHRTQPALV